MRLTTPRTVCLLLTLFLVACESFLLPEDPANDPPTNFQLLWDEFDRWYAGFGVRGVDWDALYAAHRPRVTAQTSSSELWTIVTEMLTPLDDAHTTLRDPAIGRFFIANNPLGQPRMRDFDLDLVRSSYLVSQVRIAGDGRFFYGYLPDQIGYLHINDFAGGGSGPDPDEWASEIDLIVSDFGDLRGVIVDLRHTTGGRDQNSHRIAGAFADTRRFVYSVQTRNGAEHDDFDDPEPRHVEPRGAVQFTGPIVLITDGVTVSAAEIFTILMASLPHVTHVGRPTAGAFSDSSFFRYLPNAWVYEMSHQLYTLANGVSPEGIGIVPRIPLSNTEADIAGGTDLVLDSAIAILK